MVTKRFRQEIILIGLFYFVILYNIRYYFKMIKSNHRFIYLFIKDSKFDVWGMQRELSKSELKNYFLQLSLIFFN